MNKTSRLTAGVALASMIAVSVLPAAAQTTAATTPNQPAMAMASNPSTTTSATDAAAAMAMTPEQLRETLNKRYPVGIYLPNPGDTGNTQPPRFYRAGDMVTTGVRLPNGSVVRYSMEELGRAVNTSVAACNSGDRYKARIAEYDARRTKNAKNERKRYKNGKVIGDVAHVGGAAGTAGAGFAIGASYGLVVLPMAIVGLIDHFINNGDRKTAHENNVLFNEVLGLDLDMRRGWVESMSGDVFGDGTQPEGWCGAFRYYEVSYGNKAAAAPETATPPIGKKR